MTAKFKRYTKAHGHDEISSEMLNRIMEKKVCKSNRWGRKPKEVKPLMEEERRRYFGEYGESMVDYGFAILDREMTDEEITEELDWHLRMEVNSPYDCTGQLFTKWIDWHRNPNGTVSYQHYIGLDV